MKKGELVQLLEKLDDDDEVYIGLPKHDYIDSIEVVPIGTADLYPVTEGNRLVKSDNEDYWSDKYEQKFVILDYSY